LKAWSYQPPGKNDGTVKTGTAPGGYSTRKSRYGTCPARKASPYSR
jgi:hypothetical protein